MASAVPADACGNDGVGQDPNRTETTKSPGGIIPVHAIPPRTVRALVIVEGSFDVEFLKRVSRILHADDPNLPDLRALEQAGTIIFVPIGGSNFCHWTHRLAGLEIPEFHLYDREVPPLTAEREQAADLVNRRPGCHAVLTSTRAIENFLDPHALLEARGIDIAFGDHDDVPQLVAQRMLELSGGPVWSELPSRGRRRLRDRAKKWLNTEAVARMTAARLAERDPDGDIRLWLTTIAWMAGLHN
jgi:hypothetical protein